VKDSFGREINYLRISVTDRCNFDCLYCSHPVEMLPRERVLRFEDIVVLVQAAKELGIKKVRLTGGEPLLRRDIDKLVAMLHELDVTVHTTTNGFMLARLAEPLKEAGLDGLNVSLDFVDAEKFRQITGGGDLATVVQGIDKALEVGLPVKLNAVFTTMHETKDLKELLNFGKERNLPIRFIELMPKNLGSFSSLFRPIGDAQSMIESFTNRSKHFFLAIAFSTSKSILYLHFAKAADLLGLARMSLISAMLIPNFLKTRISFNTETSSGL